MNTKVDVKREQTTISLSDEAAVKEVLVDTVFRLWDVVNSLTRLRPSRRDRYRVTIFGSARAQPGTFAYDEVKRIARSLGEWGCDIVTGGGPGLMQAANEGARSLGTQAGCQSLGIRVDLPFEQEGNPFVAEMFEHKTFFTRLHHFVLTSDAFVVAPGGIGTVLELMMIWQLLQVRHLQETPLILVGNMWKDLVDWAEQHLLTTNPPLASPQDLRLPTCVENADEAIAILKVNHQRWQDQNERSCSEQSAHTKGEAKCSANAGDQLDNDACLRESDDVVQNKPSLEQGIVRTGKSDRSRPIANQ